MASWIIVLTFVATLGYLISSNRNLSPLGLAASSATAMILCFFGLLFSAASSALLSQIGTSLGTGLLQALLVSIGTLLGLWIRHHWQRSMD